MRRVYSSLPTMPPYHTGYTTTLYTLPTYYTLGTPYTLQCLPAHACRAQRDVTEPWAQTKRNPWVGGRRETQVRKSVSLSMPLCAELLRFSR